MMILNIINHLYEKNRRPNNETPVINLAKALIAKS